MIIIDEILVSSELTERKFACNLSKCKGACCYEGDYGAPLENSEIKLIESIYEKVSKYLSSEARAKIEADGVYGFYTKDNFKGTQLVSSGACAYLYIENGISLCAFEKAYMSGEIAFKKPISCHIYPIRIEKNNLTGFEALNYDEWEICGDACSLGEELKIPVYQFVKEALIRKYGAEFYEQLDHIYKSYSDKQNKQ